MGTQGALQDIRDGNCGAKAGSQKQDRKGGGGGAELAVPPVGAVKSGKERALVAKYMALPFYCVLLICCGILNLLFNVLSKDKTFK